MHRSIHALLALAAASAGAHASTTLVATLTNGQEVPPTNPTLASGAPRPASFGTATFVINDAMNAMSFQALVNNIDFTGSQTADLNDNLIAAHIHARPDLLAPTAPVVWGFFGTPFNDTNPTNTVVTPFATGVGGTVVGTWDTAEGNNTTFAAQLQNILAGRSYINFHTVQFGGGEVRGQLVVAIPEPETYALMLAGLGAVAWVGRRKKARAAAAAR
jgi:hypothetical protein